MSLEKQTYWERLSKDEIRKKVFAALSENIDFYSDETIGVPGSHLDPEVFRNDAPFLAEAPYLSALVRNPNHIGCHTMGASEPFFKGTHQIEQELIQMCAHQIMCGSNEEEFDGYVCSGGTEANLQAAWMYRNYFMRIIGCKASEITILCSSDSHYSVHKASNLLGVKIKQVQIEDATRILTKDTVTQVVDEALAEGCKAFIVYANMMTTMFGSVDDPAIYTEVINELGIPFKMHVDAAYGGYFFPFTQGEHGLDFRNPDITSITLDAHKMVQAPYGTGVFLARKGWMDHTGTPEASYVQGADNTLIGSRSGANAIAIWMILMTYGRFGWEEKVMRLERRAKWLSDHLANMGIEHYRMENSNIVTMRAAQISEDLIQRFGLVPDDHHHPEWVKVVVMDHVTRDRLMHFLDALRENAYISSE